MMSRGINRHALLRKHKKKLKQRYGHGLYNGHRTNLRLHEDECRENYGNRANARNGGYEYWQSVYLTGPRKIAKDGTNSAIRSMYRDMLNTIDVEYADEIDALNNADYRKYFDYDWTIW